MWKRPDSFFFKYRHATFPEYSRFPEATLQHWIFLNFVDVFLMPLKENNFSFFRNKTTAVVASLQIIVLFENLLLNDVISLWKLLMLCNYFGSFLTDFRLMFQTCRFAKKINWLVFTEWRCLSLADNSFHLSFFRIHWNIYWWLHYQKSLQLSQHTLIKLSVPECRLVI